MSMPAHSPAVYPNDPSRPVLRAVLNDEPYSAEPYGSFPPPATRLVQKLALYALDAVEGTRAIAQLGGWITFEAAQRLAERRAARTERRTVLGDPRTRSAAAPGPAHLHEPVPGVFEATVVLHAEPRACSVALRFERFDGRWRATDITVL